MKDRGCPRFALCLTVCCTARPQVTGKGYRIPFGKLGGVSASLKRSCGWVVWTTLRFYFTNHGWVKKQVSGSLLRFVDSAGGGMTKIAILAVGNPKNLNADIPPNFSNGITLIQNFK